MAAGATYEPIATTTLGSAASSITFSSIPSTYTDLRLSFTVTSSSGTGSFFLRYNNVSTGSLYSVTTLAGNGSITASGNDINNSSGMQAMYALGGLSTSVPSFFGIDIFSYAGSTYKTMLMTENDDKNGSGAVGSTVGLWRSTAAINRIDLVGTGATFAAGTTATLYGIKAA